MIQSTVKELSEEQKQMIILTEDFQRFVLRAGRIMERAISENVDIYLDYIGGGDNEDINDEKSHARLSLNRVFYDDRWSKNRCITCMDWSTHFPELLVASYHNNEVRFFIVLKFFSVVFNIFSLSFDITGKSQ